MAETRLLLTFSLLVTCSVSRADDVRPVEIQIEEQEPGLFLVQWIVPKVLPPQAMPSPSLPETCGGEGERSLRERESAWVNRSLYRCVDDLHGKSLGIRYPHSNLTLTTVIRLQLLSGERYAHLLAPHETTWEIPERSLGAVTEALRFARRAVLAGVHHFTTSGVHLVFLLVLCLAGDLATSIRLATAFSAGQLVAALLRSSIGLSLEASFAETLLAVAVVFLARRALLASPGSRPLTTLVLVSGLAHGAGAAGVFAPADDGSRWLYQCFVVLGMDASLIVLAAVAAELASWLRPAHRIVATYGIGSVAVALGIHLLVLDPLAAAGRETSGVPLFADAIAASSTGGAPPSRPVAPRANDAPVQSFVAVEAFEVRHEVLVQLADVAGRLGLEPRAAIELEEQEEVKQKVRQLVLSQFAMTIDGSMRDPLSERVDFMTLDSRGALPRPVPVTESIGQALVGVTIVYLTPHTPEHISLAWSFDTAESVPVTMTDPEETRTAILVPRAPRIEWTNELIEDPTPRIEATDVEPATVRLPLVSLPFFFASGVLVVRTLRDRWPAASFALARLALALGLVLSPLGEVALALPASFGAAPAPGEARRILAGVLPNVYRAFEFREESAAYDRLAVTVVGETLTDVYLEHRRALEMEERGGARARVEAVHVIAVREVSATTGAGFEAEASWEVGGTVTHFGHRHFRQNRYEARVVVVPVEGTWKLRSIEILEETRLR